MDKKLFEDNLSTTLAQSNHGKIVLLLRYGSSRKKSDLDYFAVFENLINVQSFIAGGLDIWGISINDFKKYSSLADPFVTEPFLSGDLLYGKRDNYELMLDHIRNIEIDDVRWFPLLDSSKSSLSLFKIRKVL